MDAFIARQPVFDRDLNVYAYELLFRHGPENFFADADGEQASRTVVGDSMCVHGIDSLAAGRRVLVNVTRDFLMGKHYRVLPPEQTIVELLESVEPDDDVIRACREARTEGYLVALDDYIFESRYDAHFDEFDILKVDFGSTSEEQRASFLELCRPHTHLLAEKIETYAQFEEARKLGFMYFQGYFFCKPQVMRARTVATHSMSHARLLQLANQPELDVTALEDVIRQDVALSYKLLRYLNSAAFGLQHAVRSIPHAINLLGHRIVRRWITLMALTGMADDKPDELMSVSLIRARLCELLAEQSGSKETIDIDWFSLGMFSVIDALVDRPMADVLDDINLHPLIKHTLLGETTEARPLFMLARAIENGDWPSITAGCEQLGISPKRAYASYLEAVETADQILSTELDESDDDVQRTAS